MNGTDDPNEGFDPEQLEALEKLMDAIIEDEASGYQMIFWISHGAAKELLETFDRYYAGSDEDAVLLLVEFAKIVEQLRQTVRSDEEGN